MRTLETSKVADRLPKDFVQDVRVQGGDAADPDHLPEAKRLRLAAELGHLEDERMGGDLAFD